MTKETPSILKALNLLNKQTTTNVDTIVKPTTLLPTSKTKIGLDKMISSKPNDYVNADLKTLLQDIMNWNGENKVNKPLVRTVREYLTNPKTFNQTVEFTGFASALSPFLEADQIENLYHLIETTETSFAPTLYTINFNNNMKPIFSNYSNVRVQKIASSLWTESHKGRWWNMTVGITNIQRNQAQIKPDVLLNALKTYSTDPKMMEQIIWSEENQKNFSEYMSKKLDQDVAKMAESFRNDLMLGKPVTPDVAIFLSSIFWLSPIQRPESPINSLLRTLNKIMEADENFKLPKKADTIKDLFPNIVIDTDNSCSFPFDPNVYSLENSIDWRDVGIIPEEFKLIKNRTQLAKNGSHMHNCTVTYQRYMEKGTYALFYLKTAEGEYNFSITSSSLKPNSKWRLGELNSRFNQGNVPVAIRGKVNQIINNLPPINNMYVDYANSFNSETKSTAYQYFV